MISEIETTTDPVLSREDAIAILNTPDEELSMIELTYYPMSSYK